MKKKQCQFLVIDKKVQQNDQADSIRRQKKQLYAAFFVDIVTPLIYIFSNTDDIATKIKKIIA